MRAYYPRQSQSLFRQSGVATILIILMISLAMTAAAFGVVHSLRSNQNMQVAAHAKTNSQASAWAGAEVFRKYLAEVSKNPDDLATLSGTLPISITNHDAVLTAEIVGVQAPSATSPSDPYDITVNIRSQDQRALASAVVQVMYRVTPMACGSSKLASTLEFYRDLGLGGDVTILKESGDSANFYVDGNITMMNISTSGITSLNSTGNVTLGSGIFLPEIRANGNIEMSGSATVGKALAVGTLTTSGDAKITGEALINGDINHRGGNSGDFYSLANISIDRGGVTTGNLNAAQQVNLLQGTSVDDVSAKGNVNIYSWFSSVGDIVTESDATCHSQDWTAFSSMTVEGEAGTCSNTNVVTGVDSTITNMEPQEEFYMEPVAVDAWSVQSEANYLFSWDDDINEIKVTVKNVNTINDGDYYIGEHPTIGNTKKDYLCETVVNSKCTSDVATAKICNGESDYNACFSYDESSSTWTITGKNMAPGVVWVTGNLTLGNGEYYNTFVASGNIQTANSHKTLALNYVGYDVVCANLFPTNPSSNFTDLYPLNFCDVSAGTLKGNSLGNVALLAGGYNPVTPDDYEGGNITLGASTVISGTVMAGNYLYTEGSTTVKGYVSASGHGDAGSGSNVLGSSTTIDLTNLPATYNPDIVPSDGGECEIDSTQVSRTFWSKYL